MSGEWNAKNAAVGICQRQRSGNSLCFCLFPAGADDGVYEAGYAVFLCLDRGLLSQFVQGGGGDGAYAGGFAAFGPGEIQGEEVLRCGGAGEGDDVGRVDVPLGDSSGGVSCLGDGGVGQAFVDDGAQFC